MVCGRVMGLGWVCLLFGAGCGPLGSTTIDAADYDQSCSSNTDCAVVNDGDACEVCNCGNAAVNVSAEAAFDARYDELRGTCGAMAAIACDCELVLAYCSSEGSCEARTARYRSANEFDRSCEADADCVAVAEGEVCPECGCADAAINAGAKADWDARAEGVECGFSGLDCAACPQPTVACQNDVCVIVE